MPVDADGPHPLTAPAARRGHARSGPAVKAVEQLTIEASLTRSRAAAVQALALHPLVDSVTTARVLLEGYRARIPEIDALLR